MVSEKKTPRAKRRKRVKPRRDIGAEPAGSGLKRVNDRNRQREFLEELFNCCGWRAKAGKKLGIHRNIYNEWFKSDRWFKKQYRDLCNELQDALQASVMHRALGKSDMLAIFLLKSMNRKKYDDAFARQVAQNEGAAKIMDKYPLPRFMLAEEKKYTDFPEADEPTPQEVEREKVPLEDRDLTGRYPEDY